MQCFGIILALYKYSTPVYILINIRFKIRILYILTVNNIII